MPQAMPTRRRVERTDEPAAADNPLTREIKAALFDRAAEARPMPRVRSVSAGLGSRDVGAGRPRRRLRLARPNRPDVRRARYAMRRHPPPAALDRVPLDLRPEGAYSLRGHSIGGFGSVTTNKLVATIVGELFGLTSRPTRGTDPRRRGCRRPTT